MQNDDVFFKYFHRIFYFSSKVHYISQYLNFLNIIKNRIALYIFALRANIDTSFLNSFWSKGPLSFKIVDQSCRGSVTLESIKPVISDGISFRDGGERFELPFFFFCHKTFCSVKGFSTQPLHLNTWKEQGL